jgi:predicted DNA-binding ribbon-helix-helix protein
VPGNPGRLIIGPPAGAAMVRYDRKEAAIRKRRNGRLVWRRPGRYNGCEEAMRTMSDAPSNRYETSLETYSIKVAGRWTTVRLESELMAALKDVALAEGCEIGDICTRLAQHRRQGSLTSALRLYVLKHYRERAGQRQALGPSSELAKELESFRRSLLATEERNYVLRHDIDLDRIGEADAGIAFLFAYWKALSKGAYRPEYGDFQLETLRSIGFEANIHLIDVDAPNPDDFRILRQAPITMIYRAPDNVPMKALGETLYAREVKADYSAAKYKGDPVLHRMSVRTAEGALKYQRIILPCGGQDGRISRLVVGVTPLTRLAPRLIPTRT